MKRAGFTIVELLIVIVIIAVLAAITIVAYNGIQQRALTSTLKSELSNASKQLELAKADSDTYPLSFPNSVKVPSNVTLSLSQTTGGFCINGEYKNNSSIRWRYESTSGGLQEGLCSGSVISGSELGINANLITDTAFTQIGTNNNNWRLARSNIITAGTTRSGTSGDPYPTRPVLVISNSPTPAATWNYLGGPVNATSIVNTKSYTFSYYVRLASGVYTQPMPYFGVLDGTGTNASLNQGSSSVTPTSSWQLVSRSVTAAQNGQVSNNLYGTLNLSHVQNNSFALEFQGFELREQ